MRVVVGYTTDGTLRYEFVESLLGILHQVTGRIALKSGPAISRARNDIVRTFLDETDGTHLFMVDTDMVFGPRTLEALGSHQKPVVGALCHLLSADGTSQPVMSFWKDGKLIKPSKAKPGLQKVAATGAACLLIEREVLEKMRPNYEAPFEWFREDTWEAQPTGEDVTFCLRAQEQGFGVYVDSDCFVGHCVPVVI